MFYKTPHLPSSPAVLPLSRRSKIYFSKTPFGLTGFDHVKKIEVGLSDLPSRGKNS